MCPPSPPPHTHTHTHTHAPTRAHQQYVRPLYRALFKSKAGRQAALDTFEEAAGRYHPIARKMVAADLGVAA